VKVIYLLDVNVLFSLAFDGHSMHRRSAEWIDRQSECHFGICRLAQMGLLRLLANDHAMLGEPLNALGAWSVYDQIREDERFVELDEPPLLELRWREIGVGLGRPGVETDTYLAAFAVESGIALASFDRGFERFLSNGLQFVDLSASG